MVSRCHRRRALLKLSTSHREVSTFKWIQLKLSAMRLEEVRLRWRAVEERALCARSRECSRRGRSVTPSRRSATAKALSTRTTDPRPRRITTHPHRPHPRSHSHHPHARHAQTGTRSHSHLIPLIPLMHLLHLLHLLGLMHLLVEWSAVASTARVLQVASASAGRVRAHRGSRVCGASARGSARTWCRVAWRSERLTFLLEGARLHGLHSR